MAISDPVADYLTCIRNALQARKDSVTVPSSKMKQSITEILKSRKFVKDYTVVEEGAKKFLHIQLKYKRSGQPAIKRIQKVSKPGLRRYVENEKIPYVLNGLGTMIVSTSQGIMCDRDARKKRVGGELICKVW